METIHTKHDFGVKHGRYPQVSLTIYLHRRLPTHAPGVDVEDGRFVLFPTVQTIAMGRGQHSLSNLLSEGTSCQTQANRVATEGTVKLFIYANGCGNAFS